MLMRNIENEMFTAFINGASRKKKNDQVNTHMNKTAWYYRGNLIASLTDRKFLVLYDANWQSNTTKSRLNAILSGIKYPERIYQKNFVWYIGKNRWYNTITIYI